MPVSRAVGLLLLAAVVLAAVAAPLAPHRSAASFSGLLNAPPTLPRVRDAAGGWHRPFIHPWILVDRLEQRYRLDESTLVPLVPSGFLVQSADETNAPLLLLGTDSYGRDVFSRLLFGARLSLVLSILAALGAVLLGVAVGATAGYAGRVTDDLLMRSTAFVVILPAIYIALALRAVLPLVLEPSTVFGILAAIFAILGAPFVARGVRGIIRTERARDYVVAARSLGAGRARIVLRHLVPATFGFLGVQITMLVPAFMVAEATLSYVGFGFPDSVASWGTMLQQASNVRTLADFPWLLSPAIAIFAVTLGLNLVLQQPAINAGRISSDAARGRLRADSDPVRPF